MSISHPLPTNNFARKEQTHFHPPFISSAVFQNVSSSCNLLPIRKVYNRLKEWSAQNETDANSAIERRQSLRRAATRASLTSAISSAALSAAPRTQTIAFALRSANALRCFSVAAPRAFARSNALLEEEQQATTPLSSEARDLRSGWHCVFVQNHPYHLTRDDITDAFGKFGEIAQVDLPAGKSFFFVFFKEAQAAQEAADNVDGTFWHGRRIVCKLGKTEPRRFPDNDERQSTQRRDSRNQQRSNDTPERRRRPIDDTPSDTIYIGNISFNATDAELNELFSILKDTEAVRVAVDKTTGWPRGFAHAQFKSVEAAKAGLETIKGQVLHGRELRVNFAQPNPRAEEKKNQMDWNA
ncbi:hlh transcription factor [Colletotrichum sojae]|uniref:Hlh transcription factor n=1 Tax=Colletotrichum sojae TaxID=2175907 RepID=A0A8H6IMD6_9PEZI|nr:hlh transcription factor [Colletotrichum sojae]